MSGHEEDQRTDPSQTSGDSQQPPSGGQQRRQPMTMQDRLEAFSFMMFLVHPDQRPFSEFDGAVPERFRESLYSLARMAENFGFNADINGDVSTMIASLEPSQIVEILQGIDQDAFISTYNDHPQIRTIIQDLSEELIEDAKETMTVAQAAAFVGEENIAFSDALAALPLSAVLDGTDEFTDVVTNMGNTQVLNLLNSLPEGMQNDILAQLGSHPRENDGDPLVAIEGLDLSGMSIEQAIEARTEYAEGQGFAGLFNWSSNASDGSIDGVYDVIRASLVEDLPAELNVRLGGDPDHPIDIDPARLYVMLQEELQQEGGGNIGNLLTTDRMNMIREQLGEIEDHSFLINLLPQHIQDEALFNKLRETMNEFGLLGPAGSIIMQLAGFVLNLVETYAPNLIGQERTDQVLAQINGYLDPSIEAQTPVIPEENQTDPTLTLDAQPGQQP